MTDPLDPFPRDSNGKRIGGPFTWIALHLFPQAVEIGWRPLPLTDMLSHPVVDGRGVLCGWFGEGEMRLPWEMEETKCA